MYFNVFIPFEVQERLTYTREPQILSVRKFFISVRVSNERGPWKHKGLIKETHYLKKILCFSLLDWRIKKIKKIQGGQWFGKDNAPVLWVGVTFTVK